MPALGHPPIIDPSGIATELVKCLVIFILGGTVAKLTRWVEGYRQTQQGVTGIQSSLEVLGKSISDLKNLFEQRSAEMEEQFDNRFTRLEGQFTKRFESLESSITRVDDSSHAWKNQAQAIINRQEGKIIRIEERLRAFMLMTGGHERLRELEALLPAVSVSVSEEDPNDTPS